MEDVEEADGRGGDEQVDQYVDGVCGVCVVVDGVEGVGICDRDRNIMALRTSRGEYDVLRLQWLQWTLSFEN